MGYTVLAGGPPWVFSFLASLVDVVTLPNGRSTWANVWDGDGLGRGESAEEAEPIVEWCMAQFVDFWRGQPGFGGSVTRMVASIRPKLGLGASPAPPVISSRRSRRSETSSPPPS